jgi:hypothetical protein
VPASNGVSQASLNIPRGMTAAAMPRGTESSRNVRNRVIQSPAGAPWPQYSNAAAATNYPRSQPSPNQTPQTDQVEQWNHQNGVW